MTTEATDDVTTEQTTAVPTAHESREARIQKALAGLPSRDAPPPAQAKAEPAPKLEAAAPEKNPEPAADAEPDAKTTPATPAPQQDDADMRIARMERATRQKEREAYEANQAKRGLEKDLADARAALEKEREARTKYQAELEGMSPLEVLEKVKKTNYEQLTKDIVENKFAPRSPEQIAIEEVRRESAAARAELEELRAERQREREDREAELARSNEAAQDAANAEKIGGLLKQHRQHFPILATLPWAASTIVREAKRTGQSYDDVAATMEKAARGDVSTVFDSDDALDVILSDQKYIDRLRNHPRFKQLQSASPASDEGSGSQRKGAPSAIPQSRASDPGTRVKQSRPVTTEDRVARGIAQLEGRRSR